MTPEQKAEFDRLIAENAALKAAAVRKQTLSCKVSAKGALSVYGLGRFPVTLYKSQWKRLMDAKGTITAFIEANDSSLVSKN